MAGAAGGEPFRASAAAEAMYAAVAVPAGVPAVAVAIFAAAAAAWETAAVGQCFAALSPSPPLPSTLAPSSYLAAPLPHHRLHPRTPAALFPLPHLLLQAPAAHGRSA